MLSAIKSLFFFLVFDILRVMRHYFLRSFCLRDEPTLEEMHKNMVLSKVVCTFPFVKDTDNIQKITHLIFDGFYLQISL